MASFFNLHFIARKINVCKTKLHGFVTKNYYFQISFARVERRVWVQKIMTIPRTISRRILILLSFVIIMIHRYVRMYTIYGKNSPKVQKSQVSTIYVHNIVCFRFLTVVTYTVLVRVYRSVTETLLPMHASTKCKSILFTLRWRALRTSHEIIFGKRFDCWI